ncbi:hypothetical protein [Mycolicibacterium sp. F2034L]|uniref:hypothetical protein n=1 Tax=Mycolicibacterium sp. F2034L TaxID=2926422 RepID=UPI001FF322A2|nr:hypothetical protein [Mycolicibacterium sp. F2034L]MCK0174813.1 hypothetical protein [Mycolicibacterium sp. F2034L]
MPEPTPTSNLIEMSENQPQVLVAQKLPSSYAQIFVGEANTTTVILTITLDNTSASTRTVQLFLGKDEGGSARVAYIELAPNESCVVEELMGAGLQPGDYIGGHASAASAVDIAITGSVSK